jgi:hypothetical protein
MVEGPARCAFKDGKIQLQLSERLRRRQQQSWMVAAAAAEEVDGAAANL